MILRLLLCVVLGCSMAGCSTAAKKKAEAAKKALGPTMPDVSGDMAFQAFIGRLRKAVAAHDEVTVASMMTENFGYRLDPPGEGPGVFQYWDDELLWPQFVPKGNFMVAPAEFVTDPGFHGFRAGMTSLDGTWKFAYFVTDSPQQ